MTVLHSRGGSGFSGWCFWDSPFLPVSPRPWPLGSQRNDAGSPSGSHATLTRHRMVPRCPKVQAVGPGAAVPPADVGTLEKGYISVFLGSSMSENHSENVTNI